MSRSFLVSLALAGCIACSPVTPSVDADAGGTDGGADAGVTSFDTRCNDGGLCLDWWVRVGGDSVPATVRAVRATADGVVFVGGADRTGAGLPIADVTVPSTESSAVAYVARLDEAGHLVSAATAHGDLIQQLNYFLDFTILPDGDVLAVGAGDVPRSEGGSSVMTARVGPDGTLRWSDANIAGIEMEHFAVATCVTSSSAGRVFFGGLADDPLDGPAGPQTIRGIVAEMDPDTHRLAWFRVLGLSVDVWFLVMSEDVPYVLVTVRQVPWDLGPVGVIPPSLVDAFVVRLDPTDGAPRAFARVPGVFGYRINSFSVTADGSFRVVGDGGVFRVAADLSTVERVTNLEPGATGAVTVRGTQLLVSGAADTLFRGRAVPAQTSWLMLYDGSGDAVLELADGDDPVSQSIALGTVLDDRTYVYGAFTTGFRFGPFVSSPMVDRFFEGTGYVMQVRAP